jgi:two-component system, LuxR family, response regulator FixJ
MGETDDKRAVIVIDDDRDMRAAIALMLESAGLRVETYTCAEEFLSSPFVHDSPKCLILDVRMRALSGLGLQQRLLLDGVQLPIIFLTGFGDVASAVQAIRSGGFDFLEKPLHCRVLLERVRAALDFDAQLLMAGNERSAIHERIQSLSRRERDVFNAVVQGKSNKEIATALHIGMPTVTKHRARMLKKIGVRNAFELNELVSRHDANSRTISSGSGPLDRTRRGHNAIAAPTSGVHTQDRGVLPVR